MVNMQRRAIFFIDGFNLYHSIDSKKELRKYKWLNLWKFSELLLEANEKLVGLYYFTAYTEWNISRMRRHQDYVEINQHQGCEVILGKFQEKNRKSRVACSQPCLQELGGQFCEKQYTAHEEKMTDVNIAIGILNFRSW